MLDRGLISRHFEGDITLDGLREALVAAKIKITKYDPTKQRPVVTSVGNMDIRKFSGVLLEKLGASMIGFPEIIKAAHDTTSMEEILEKFAKEEGLVAGEGEEEEIVIPDELKDYTLNVNKSARRNEDEFFLTTPKEFVSRTSGRYYINKCRIPLPEAYSMARAVIPDYRPRSRPGVFTEINMQTEEEENIFNTYNPPEWYQWRKENQEAWRELPSSPPEIFLKLLKHLIPAKVERQYLYAWLYASMTARSYVFLVLSGAPGAGKNRLKLVMRALHGRDNTVDGKKSTFTERFNSQLSRGTLSWFDELKYDSDMENVMKEVQNDYVSIEKKGVDATSSSTIYSSMVLSNNKPRDNFIAFDARKFAPLKLGVNDLRNSMSEQEIDLLSKKVESNHPDFDVTFVAQIAKWILKIGARNLRKWPTLEYRGPMFWILAHTSMTRWQKKAVTSLIDLKTGARVGWDDNEKAHLWSKVEEKINKKNGVEHGMVFPDYTSIRAFFDVFRDGDGQKGFETKVVPGNNLLGDFWIYPLTTGAITLITEATVAQERERERKKNGKDNQIIDL